MWNYIFFFYINSTERECKRESYSFYNVFKHYLLKIYVTSPTFVCVFKICICWNLFYSLRWDYLYMMTLNIDYIAINEMFFLRKNEVSAHLFYLTLLTQSENLAFPIRLDLWNLTVHSSWVFQVNTEKRARPSLTA